MIDLSSLRLDAATWLDFNTKLQTKKNNLRKMLSEKGVLQRGGKNDFEHYSYFSEAQYKELFTQLFSACGLELQVSEVDYQIFEGTDKQPNGRRIVLDFALSDIETGFCEISKLSGEGIDKGDKAIYKAYTGAVKYYLANTFLVATGDDPEKDSPDMRSTQRKATGRKATEKQLQLIERAYAGNVGDLLAYYHISSLDELSMQDASNIISQIKGAN